MEENFCNKCGECCRSIPVNFSKNILLWDSAEVLTSDFKEMLIVIKNEGNISICSCKFLVNNLCTNPHKPDICMKYPNSVFIELPENCTYSGYVFQKTERIKQKIRKLKEEIIHYTAIIETTNDKSEINQLNKIIRSHESQINKYKEYGSYDW